MAGIYDLDVICAECISDKVAIRNKAIERLDGLLMSHKEDIFLLLKNERNLKHMSWNVIFESAINATIKHSVCLDDMQLKKGTQYLQNKNYTYRSVVNKILDYNVEGNFLSKSAIFSSFTEGFGSRSTIKHFGALFLNLLDRGLYKSLVYIQDIKINEFSRILSYLFEVNVGNDLLRFAILQTIIKTIEIGTTNVILNFDLIGYLPEIYIYAQKASDDRKKFDVLKLFHIFIINLSTDYHFTVGTDLQNLIPILCGYYFTSMKNEAKELFFKSVYEFLSNLYPNICSGDYSTFPISLNDNWSKTLKKLMSIVDMEIKASRLRQDQIDSEICRKSFVDMASLIIYLLEWNKRDDDILQPKSKKPKRSDPLEIVLNFLHENPTSNEIWFCILSTLIFNYDCVLNSSNYENVLTAVSLIYEAKPTKNTLHYINICIRALLKADFHHEMSHATKNSNQELWKKFTEMLVSESSNSSEILLEKQKLLQTLIPYGMMSKAQCEALIQSFISITAMKRNECIITVRVILDNSDICGIDKTSDLCARIISWLYDTNAMSSDVKNLIRNVNSIDTELISDAAATAVINFLEKKISAEPTEIFDHLTNFDILQYKYLKKCVFINKNETQIQLFNKKSSKNSKTVLTNCVFQQNYEHLIRIINFDISKSNSTNDILYDLDCLYKISCVMNFLVQYKVFNNENYTQCPLTKRIVLFLNHIEFKLKINRNNFIDNSDVLELLRKLICIFKLYEANQILLCYIEAQPLEELIGFIGNSLKYALEMQSNELGDWKSVVKECLIFLALLCSSKSHCQSAFTYLSKHKFNLKSDLDVLISLLRILCNQKNVNFMVAEWFVEKLKDMLKHYYMSQELVGEIISFLPDVFTYVQEFEVLVQDLLIALMSLLKLAYKKSYSIPLSTKIVNIIKLIAEKCANLNKESNFVNICLSTAKFLQHPSLEIQFATINTITTLMSCNWLKTLNINKRDHFDFCQKLYSYIDWRSLPTSTKDLIQNSNSVTVQTLVAIFVCSAHHQEMAIEELAYFCALRKLTEVDFSLLQHICLHYNCSMKQLTKSFVPNLTHTWMSKQYPILKFPYYLCYKTREDFILQNVETIAAGLLIYVPSLKLEDLPIIKNIRKDEFLQFAVPIVAAIILPQLSICPETETKEYHQYYSTLTDNMNTFKLDVNSLCSNSLMNWKTILSLTTQLRDNKHFQDLCGYTVWSNMHKWFNLSYTSFKKCILYNLDKSFKNSDSTSHLFYTLTISNPQLLVNVINELKDNFMTSFFLIEQLKSLCMYNTIILLIIESLPANKKCGDFAEHIIMFFVRDMLFLILQYLQDDEHRNIHVFLINMLQCTLLNYLKENEIVIKIIRMYIQDIVRCIVTLYENSDDIEIKNLLVSTIKYIADHCKKVKEIMDYLCNLPNINDFIELRNLHEVNQLEMKSTNLPLVVKSVLEGKHNTESLKLLHEFLALNKMDFQLQEDMLSELIKFLIYIICDSENEERKILASQCLGEIGSQKLQGVSFYFQTDVLFYNDASKSVDPIYSFVSSILTLLDSLLRTFKQGQHQIIGRISEQLINLELKMYDLFPFFNVFKSSQSRSTSLNQFQIVKNIDWIDILKQTVHYEYDVWICQFVSNIFKCCGWDDFHDLAIYNINFADAALQLFIKFLTSNKSNQNKGLIQMLEYFFEQFYIHCFTNVERGTNDVVKGRNIFRDKRIINKFLNICECVRIHLKQSLPTNLLYVVKASNYCQSFFMSIMYLEIWVLNEKDANNTSIKEIISNEIFQKASKEAYEAIGDTSALSVILSPLQSRIDFLNLYNNWSDILMEDNSTKIIPEQYYVSMLKRNGMIALANKFQIKSKVDYEVCWRLCQWETLIDNNMNLSTINDLEQEFEKHHFNALKCLFNREENNTLAAISNARSCVISIFKEISIECLQNIYKYLTWFELLQQVEDFCKIQFITNTSAETIFDKWQNTSNLNYASFRCKELTLSHQIVLFKTAGLRAKRKMQEYYKESPIERFLLKCIKECKKTGEINLAKSNISILKSNENINEHIQAGVYLEDALICLETGKFEIAEPLLQYIIENEAFAFCLERVCALKVYGEYLMETNSDNFDNVLSTYFNGSIHLLKQFDKSKDQILQKYPNAFHLNEFSAFEQVNRKAVFEVIAKYADREYTHLNSFLNSDEIKTKDKIIKQNKLVLDSMRKAREQGKNMGAVFIHKFANLDQKELELSTQKCMEYLCIAVENYIYFCNVDDSISSPVIYRIFGLWFSNKQNEILQAHIVKHIGSIPSYKFICAFNQIIARLNSDNESFISVLKEILVKCVRSHPHHTLYQLYPLIYAFSDAPNNNKNIRSNIAKEIITQAKNDLNLNIIKQLESMFPILIQFANVDNTQKNNETKLSNKLKLLKNLNAIHCPTLDLKVSINSDYNIISIVKWEDNVSLVGGINAPKKLMCVCSDGKVRPQLLKGKDDLRQDAVMQQVFSMINKMLSGASEILEKNYKLRTYKVVPLSMRSGILEWCENTTPIGEYLVGNKGGAHKKYRPNDMSHTNCRQLSNQHLKSSSKKRHDIFQYICSKIKPVFHHFFFEKFLIPGVWFERRLAYIYSVATTSVVGYILGLGDRHTQNILIDNQTAEVIHIDFGIAFEQGKIMPTPETVPFRLTRDMVSPMGVCETRGVFKRSCIDTLLILRKNQGVITTILDVLLYDPLYNWKVVTSCSTEGEGSSDEENIIAQRALLTTQNKLEGKRSGVFGATTVDVQIQQLINDAVSSRNLCLLYPGWDPYL